MILSIIVLNRNSKCYCPKQKLCFPNYSWARQHQINVALSLLRVEQQTRLQQLPSLKVLWYDAAWVQTHNLPIVR